MEYTCECGRSFAKSQSLNAHQSHCGKEGRFVPSAWNRGLTKESDPRVALNAEQVSRSTRGVSRSPLSEEHKRKISETCLRKAANGTWHNSFSKARTHEYRGVKFYGSWEVSYAKYLDENGIPWERPRRRFRYRFEGKNRHYTPDFYLPATDEWVEVKGYPTDKDFAKWDAFPHELTILNGRDLHELGLIDSFSPVDRIYRGKSWA